jgi:serine-type D-Ala-D-Ala carboxypeptidase/endopeptidase (penicillin-binding protein 4)
MRARPNSLLTFSAILSACATPAAKVEPASIAVAAPSRDVDGEKATAVVVPTLPTRPPLAPAHMALQPLEAPPTDAAARMQWLNQNLDRLLGGLGQDPPALPGATVSVLVVEQDTGRIIYARNPDASLNAASNVKLVTSAAALTLLGPEYRFETVVYGTPSPDGRLIGPGGKLQGDLVIKGSGDPSLEHPHLDRLAGQLAALGIRQISGGLVIDASLFGDGTLPPHFDEKLESGAFRAPSSAASLDGNTVSITVVPGPATGTPARIAVVPQSPYVSLTGRILTTDREPAWPTLDTNETADQTIVTLGGRVLIGSEPRTHRRRIGHPELNLGSALIVALKANGITLGQGMRTGTAPEGLRRLATHTSAALGVIVRSMNKQSDNFTAEQLLRKLGAETTRSPGTWKNGTEAVSRYLQSIGIAPDSYRMDNASGLYDSNRFSARQLVKLLAAALSDFRIAGEYAASLALAGSDGTLATRMVGTPAERYVRAKTGTLANASCLSGIVGAPGQKPLLFSILMNQLNDTALARAIQDQSSAALAWYLSPSATPGTDAR